MTNYPKYDNFKNITKGNYTKVDNIFIKNKLEQSKNIIETMLSNLDNFQLLKFNLGKLNNKINEINKILIAEDKY